MIAAWEAEIAELEAENSRLRALKSSLSGPVTSTIDNTALNLDSAHNSLKKGFTVEKETADNNSIKNNITELNGLVSTISGSVIPSIDGQIAANNARIAQLKALIAAELARQAAEAAAAAAASSRQGSR